LRFLSAAAAPEFSRGL